MPKTSCVCLIAFCSCIRIPAFHNYTCGASVCVSRSYLTSKVAAPAAMRHHQNDSCITLFGPSLFAKRLSKCTYKGVCLPPCKFLQRQDLPTHVPHRSTISDRCTHLSISDREPVTVATKSSHLCLNIKKLIARNKFIVSLAQARLVSPV